VWCEDEAGPYQAIPQPGPSWQPVGLPAQQPHEYVRGGTAKLLTLLHPASGQVRALPVEHTPNIVLHPWLRRELAAIVAALPPLLPKEATTRATHAYWEQWRAGLIVKPTLLTELPPLRVLLVLDNLTGHHTPDWLCWCFAHGILPLFTPLGGSWLNMAESVQRILARRALDGQQPTSAQQVMEWLAATVRGWNAAPTPFVWGGRRQQRRWRARQRHHTHHALYAVHPVGGSGALTHRPLPRRRQRPSRYERLCA